jgi:alcohol dehydrogenase class IV
LLGRFLVRAVADAADDEAREHVMWAATLAGLAFGNAGVHVPHAMAYAVAGRVRAFHAPGYPDAPLVPHGMAVAVNAPAVIRHTAPLSPDRHREAAVLLGGDGDLEARVVELMRATGIPNGVAGVGYTADDIPALVATTLPQQRLLANAPCEITGSILATMFERALHYW